MPTVLVTGANRGLGLEFAKQYATAGWKVFATCRQPAQAHALYQAHKNVEVVTLDVTDSAGIWALSHQLKDETIDVFIANAGVLPLPPHTPPREIDEAIWMNAFKTNAVAHLVCADAFLPQVARSDHRKMLAVGSWVGSISCNTTGGHYVYRASKAALHAIWRSFALDHPEIIAAVLSPGPLRTDMTRYDPEWWSKLEEPPAVIRKLRALIAGMTKVDSGKFFHYTGETVPW